MKSILYLTDFAYQAKGRRYCDEDICITDYLRQRFDVATCHPACCEPFEDAADLVVFRNAGAVVGFQDAYDAFRERVVRKGLRTYNEFKGKADMAGKQYLLEKPLGADFALLGGSIVDESGNVFYRGTTKNFNPMMAQAADTVIVEAEKLVKVGEIEPESVHTPALFVDYIYVEQ